MPKRRQKNSQKDSDLPKDKANTKEIPDKNDDNDNNHSEGDDGIPWLHEYIKRQKRPGKETDTGPSTSQAGRSSSSSGAQSKTLTSSTSFRSWMPSLRGHEVPTIGDIANTGDYAIIPLTSSEDIVAVVRLASPPLSAAKLGVVNYKFSLKILHSELIDSPRLEDFNARLFEVVHLIYCLLLSWHGHQNSQVNLQMTHR